MSAGLTAGAGLLQGVSQYEAGRARSNLYDANAAIATRQANSEAAAGSYNANLIRLKGAALTGQQIANTGGNNLQQGGTPAQVVASSAAINEMDALQTQNNALRRAWGFQVQGVSDRYQAENASRGGDFALAGSILSGGAKAFTQANTPTNQSGGVAGWF